MCASTGLKREWIIGQHLNKLRGPKGELQGAILTVIMLLQGSKPSAPISS